jgi:hypothetical protein
MGPQLVDQVHRGGTRVYEILEGIMVTKLCDGVGLKWELARMEKTWQRAVGAPFKGAQQWEGVGEGDIVFISRARSPEPRFRFEINPSTNRRA